MRHINQHIFICCLFVFSLGCTNKKDNKYAFVGFGNNIARDNQLNLPLNNNTTFEFKIPDKLKDKYSKFAIDLVEINNYYFNDSLEKFLYRRRLVKNWLDSNNVKYSEKPIYFLYFADKQSISVVPIPIAYYITKNKSESVKASMYNLFCIHTNNIDDTTNLKNLCSNTDSILKLKAPNNDAYVYVFENTYYIGKKNIPLTEIYYPVNFKPFISGTLSERIVLLAKTK